MRELNQLGFQPRPLESVLRQRRRSPGPGAALQGRSHRARTGTVSPRRRGVWALQRTFRVARVRFESDTHQRGKNQARDPGPAPPGPAGTDATSARTCVGRRLPQAAPGCPRLPLAKGQAPCESPRSLPGPLGPLCRGIEAWKGRSGPRSDLRGAARRDWSTHKLKPTPSTRSIIDQT